MGLLISVALSFGITFFYALIIYWLDRYEKEPKRLLIGVFLWGAVVAIIGAILAEMVFAVGTFLFTRSETLSEGLTGSIAAPLVEETLKGLAVLLVFLIFRSEFDSILDGIVYAGITALGFAAIENALYAYGFGYREHGMEGMYAVLFVRGILGGWDHPMWTAFTGIGLAAARLTRNTAAKLTAPMGG